MNDLSSGFLLVDKPKGITSFDIVYRLRKITGIKKIGHAGTLDPLATGLMICAIGRDATKKIDQYIKKDKKYTVDILLGQTSATYDLEAELVETKIKRDVTLLDVETALKYFLGEIEQVPPIYSAKKIKGKKAYELARSGEVFSLPSQKVCIYSVSIVNFHFPKLEIDVHCSSGTYIRTLVHDVGQKLLIGAVMADLRRTTIGLFDVADAHLLSEIDKNNWNTFLFSEN